MLTSRSVAEQVKYRVGGALFSGTLTIEQGRLLDPVEEGVSVAVSVSGKSLVHSANLTLIAFNQGYLGSYGQYVVTMGLLLFAFSTVIAWSYYGDRAVIYLVGVRGVMPYRVLYVAGFFWASFAETSFIWDLASVTIVLMTLPNLFAILLLRKEMKQTIADYWQKFNA